MPTGRTPNLDLALPVQGELSGTWGDEVNNGITDYVDIAVAGTLTLTGDGAVTLAKTQGAAAGDNIGSTTAQYAILRIVGPLSTTKVITAPSSSKSYIVINTDSTHGVTVKASGQTGVTVAAGTRSTVVFNGTDYVSVSTSAGTGDVVASANNTLTGANTFSGANSFTNANNFTGANTFYNNTGQTFGTATSTQDGIIIAGRAGGSSSFRVTVAPNTLTASRSVTFPDAAGAVLLDTATQTVTNKRVTPRSVDIASAATITPTGDTADQYEVTALATPATIAAPSGTPTDGQKLIIRIKDDGTARALTWTTTSGAYRAVGVTLPTTTVLSKVLYVGCIYNAQDVFWDVVAVAQLA